MGRRYDAPPPSSRLGKLNYTNKTGGAGDEVGKCSLKDCSTDNLFARSELKHDLDTVAVVELPDPAWAAWNDALDDVLSRGSPGCTGSETSSCRMAVQDELHIRCMDANDDPNAPACRAMVEATPSVGDQLKGAVQIASIITAAVGIESFGLGALAELEVGGTIVAAGTVETGATAGTDAADAASSASRLAPTEISGFARSADNLYQGFARAMFRDGVGVSNSAMEDAVSNPIEVVEQSNGTWKFVGQNGVVVLNDDGEVVTTWATSSGGWRYPAGTLEGWPNQ